MRGLLWLLALSAYVPHTWACEEILNAGHFKKPVSSLVIPRAQNFLYKFTGENAFIPIQYSRKKFWTVMFDPNDSSHNAGYVVRGIIHHKNYITKSVTPSTHENEKEFFKTVARMHHMENLVLDLKRPFHNCTGLAVSGWVDAKLWLKHGLRMADVPPLLARAESEQFFDSKTRDPRYRVRAHDKFGRPMVIVVAKKPECPNILVTAFADSDED